MEGYWIWGGSMVRVGTEYHLFASRWAKNKAFPEGYRQNSEIVRATSDSPYGPFKFAEVVIGERDSSFWDSNMAHNPSIYKVGDEYVLFYIGSDFTTFRGNSNYLLRRVGYATSGAVTGPWNRSDNPVIDTESNNPAILVDDNKVKLVFRDASLRVYLAESDSYKGPYQIVNDNLWPASPLEDFYIFKAGGLTHIICEDNVGRLSGHERWGVHIYSVDGIHDWKKYDPVVIYDNTILFDDNSVLRCLRRERPQLFISDGEIIYLLNGVYDGNDSWCQPVKLKKPVKTD
ncbi:MAG: glycoside hydrolase family protein [Bacteroidales bacterium]